MTAEWSSSTILYAVVLLSVHVTQCPVSFKGPRSSCQLVFHQWNVSPILCCSFVRAWCIYAAVFVHYVIMYFMFGAPIF